MLANTTKHECSVLEYRYIHVVDWPRFVLTVRAYIELKNDALPDLRKVYVYFFVTRKETLEILLRLYFVTFLVVTNCFLLTVYIELIFYENKWWQQTMLHRGKWKWLPRPSSLFFQEVLSHWMSHPVRLLLLLKINYVCLLNYTYHRRINYSNYQDFDEYIFGSFINKNFILHERNIMISWCYITSST